jgi:hypothetical protein
VKLNYRFYKENFIKLALLSVPIIIILVEHLRGKGNPKDEVGALALLAVIVVFANVGLFIAMTRARRKEEAASEQGTSALSIGAITVDQDASVPLSQGASVKRRRMRYVMSCWAIGGGGFLAVFLKSCLLDGIIPVPWIGYFFIIIGILGLCGVNVFYGGPLDLRLDREQDL